MKSYFPLQLDTDEDGKLSFEEFRVLFVNQEKRKRRAREKAEEVINKRPQLSLRSPQIGLNKSPL